MSVIVALKELLFEGGPRPKTVDCGECPVGLSCMNQSAELGGTHHDCCGAVSLSLEGSIYDERAPRTIVDCATHRFQSQKMNGEILCPLCSGDIVTVTALNLRDYRYIHTANAKATIDQRLETWETRRTAASAIRRLLMGRTDESQ